MIASGSFDRTVKVWEQAVPGDGDGPHWEMLPSETEEQIFDELGVDFIEPEKRNHAFLTSKAGYMKTKGPITMAR